VQGRKQARRVRRATHDDCYGHEQKLPEFIRYHLHYDGIAHDMKLNVDMFTIDFEGRVHVFDSHC
jgi:hypothetical protein